MIEIPNMIGIAFFAIGILSLLFFPLKANAEYYYVSDELSINNPKLGIYHKDIISDNTSIIISIILGVTSIVFPFFKDIIFRNNNPRKCKITNY